MSLMILLFDVGLETRIKRLGKGRVEIRKGKSEERRNDWENRRGGSKEKRRGNETQIWIFFYQILVGELYIGRVKDNNGINSFQYIEQ